VINKLRAEWRPFALALVIGAIGGYVFQLLKLPLPWMLGPMAATTAAALMGATLKVPSWARDTMLPIVAVMLGSTFEPSWFRRMDEFAVSLPLVLLNSLFLAVLAMLYLRRTYDLPTTYFAGVPGAITQVVVLGPQRGGNPRAISTIQGVRVLIVVAAIPLIVGIGMADQVGQPKPMSWALPPVDIAIMTASAIVGVWVGRKLKFPTPIMTGPIFVSAILHLASITDAQVPDLIMIAAQLVIGASIGGRFAGSSPKELARDMKQALTLTGISLAGTFAMSLLLARISGLDLAVCLLAMTPGGLGEMTLVALALDVDPSFVATHHVIRVTLLYFIVPIAYDRWMAHRVPKPDAPPG
jgi:hypothetical protein